VLKRPLFCLLVALLITPSSFAGVVDGMGPSINKALRFEQLTEALVRSFEPLYDDGGYINSGEVFFVKSVKNETLHYELDRFAIHIVSVSNARTSPTVQVNVYVNNAAQAKLDQLELLVQHAMRKSGWVGQTTQFRKGVRLGVGVGDEQIPMLGANNVQIARFLENMSHLAQRLKKEDFNSVLRK
jgi:hypothetical protein